MPETQFELLAAQQGPEPPPESYVETALFLAGQSAMRLINAGTVDRALDFFEQVVKRDGPLKLYARQQEAILKAKMGQEKEAVDLYEIIFASAGCRSRIAAGGALRKSRKSARFGSRQSQGPGMRPESGERRPHVCPVGLSMPFDVSSALAKSRRSTRRGTTLKLLGRGGGRAQCSAGGRLAANFDLRRGSWSISGIIRRAFVQAARIFEGKGRVEGGDRDLRQNGQDGRPAHRRCAEDRAGTAVAAFYLGVAV